MKRVLGRIIAAIAVGGLVSACAPSDSDDSNSLGTRILTPVANEEGGYSLKVSVLEELTNVEFLQGRYANFFLSPRIVDGQLEGLRPKSKFIENSKGELIPGDSLTQQMATIYLQMQKMAKLDEELGVGAVNKWPRSVGVAVNIRGGSVNNAFYDGGTDSFLFVPYNQKNLPIAINSGILAHEHFHSLFYKMVMKDSPYRGNVHNIEVESIIAGMASEGEGKVEEELPSPGKIRPVFETQQTLLQNDINFYYYFALSRALNEGLADFWGWMYTGDPDFLAQSLPSEKGSRSLKTILSGLSMKLPTEQELSADLQNYFAMSASMNRKDFAVSYAYRLATRYARVFKSFTDIYAKSRNLDEQVARKEVARILIKTFPSLQKAFALNVTNTKYSPLEILVELAKQVPNLSLEECEYLGRVLNNSEALNYYSCSQEDEKTILTREKQEDPETSLDNPQEVTP